MSTRDIELVNMVGEYLIAHANMNYVDLQDMVDTLQASSYRYSRMKKQVFANLVRRAYQNYCDQNNVVHAGISPATGASSVSSTNRGSNSDSDIEIEEPVPASLMKNQMTNLYTTPKPTDTIPVKSPFRPAFEVPPSVAARKSGQQRIPSPQPSDSSSKSEEDEDDLEIIEEVQSITSRNGSCDGKTPPRTLPVTIVQTLQPIIKKNISDKKESPKSSPNPSTPPATEPDGGKQTSTTNLVANINKPGVSISLINTESKQSQSQQQLEKRGTKRRLYVVQQETIRDQANNGQSSLKNNKMNVIKAESSAAGKGESFSSLNDSKKLRKQVTVVHDTGVTFSDFGGNDKIIEEICKLLMHLKHPEIYRELGVIPPRGFLLHGAPGCGKTLLANAIAGELKMPLLKVAATELISGISGESESNIRDLFEQALSLAPSIIFIDEIDSITPKRETAQREMERRIVSQLLTCIDEIGTKDKGDQVLLIGATNRIETIDVALRRAGRFDREICLGIPDVKAREQILRVLFRNLRLSPNFDYSLLAKLTPGYVGADLQALMREAAVQAVDKILSGQHASKAENKTSVPETSPLGNSAIAEGENANEKGNIDPGNDKEPKDMETQPLEVPDQSNNNTSAAAGESEPMDLEAPANSVPISSDSNASANLAATAVPPPQPKEKDFFKWIRDTAPLPETTLENLCLHMEDFERALKFVQPSSKREGFATVPDTTWNDIGALSEIREELQVSILGPVKHASAFQSLGLNSPAGVLLCGPPGCGKTLLAKAVANEAGINFISVKGPELLNMYVGESERAVRQCFLRAKNSSPCVIFFDELDALCPRRSDGIESGSTSRVVNQLLTEMDGMESRAGVFVMAATNRPDIIDPAILRPGRLDKVIFVNLPTPTDRLDILKAITKNGTQPRFADDVDLKSIAQSEKLDGFTGADLAAIVREAAIAAFRELVLEAGKTNEKTICPDAELKVYGRHFEIAILRTKPSVTLKDREKYSQMKERYSSLLT